MVALAAVSRGEEEDAADHREQGAEGRGTKQEGDWVMGEGERTESRNGVRGWERHWQSQATKVKVATGKGRWRMKSIGWEGQGR